MIFLRLLKVRADRDPRIRRNSRSHTFHVLRVRQCCLNAPRGKHIAQSAGVSDLDVPHIDAYMSSDGWDLEKEAALLRRLAGL